MRVTNSAGSKGSYGSYCDTSKFEYAVNTPYYLLA